MRWWNRENYSQRRSLQIRQHAGYHTGARKNELRRIQWPQVDFDGNVIRLVFGRPSSVNSTSCSCLGEPKLNSCPVAANAPCSAALTSPPRLADMSMK